MLHMITTRHTQDNVTYPRQQSEGGLAGTPQWVGRIASIHRALSPVLAYAWNMQNWYHLPHGAQLRKLKPPNLKRSPTITQPVRTETWLHSRPFQFQAFPVVFLWQLFIQLSKLKFFLNCPWNAPSHRPLHFKVINMGERKRGARSGLFIYFVTAQGQTQVMFPLPYLAVQGEGYFENPFPGQHVPWGILRVRSSLPYCGRSALVGIASELLQGSGGFRNVGLGSQASSQSSFC